MILNDTHIEQLNETFKFVSDYDFSGYSKKSFIRRIEKILSDYALDFEELLLKIKTDRNFLETVVRDITVNTTELFRDPKVWQTIKHRILKKLKDKETIHIWHAGCSTGQEIYSMKVLLHEAGLQDKTKLYASDINTSVIKKAQEGVYQYRFNIDYLDNYRQVVQLNPYNFETFNNVPFTKYFEIDDIKDTITVKPFLKENIEYAQHNLVHLDNIFKIKFDIILCRNVLIYFNSNLQNSLFRLFADNLRKKAFLILGAHETIMNEEAYGLIKHGNYYIKK